MTRRRVVFAVAAALFVALLVVTALKDEHIVTVTL